MVKNNIREAIFKVITDNCDGTWNGLSESSSLCVDDPVLFAEEITKVVNAEIDREVLRKFFNSKYGKKVLKPFDHMYYFNGEPITVRVSMKKFRVTE